MLDFSSFPADIPSDMPSEVKSILSDLARDSFELRELWWYTLVLGLIDCERVWFQRTYWQDGRKWHLFRTVLGEEFSLPDPSISEQTENKLRTAARLLLGDSNEQDLKWKSTIWVEYRNCSDCEPSPQLCADCRG
jgi:hypothetical protein